MAKKKALMLGNPSIAEYDGFQERGNTFTVVGTAFKSIFLLAILMVAFGYTWHLSTLGYAEQFATQVDGHVPDSIAIPSNVVGLAVGGSLVGFILAMVIIFRQTTAPYLSPIYAACQGLFLGAISAGFEAKFPGIVLQAVGATFGVSLGMMFFYGTGILRPTQKFMIWLLSAMIGIVVLYLVDLVMQMCGSYVSVVHSSGPWGIALQLFIVGIAALNLVVDFGLITASAEDRAPKWFEWYGAFSIMVTLVWLYLEMLRLFAKLRNGD